MTEIAIAASAFLTWVLICFGLHLVHKCTLLLGRCAAALEQLNQRAAAPRAAKPVTPAAGQPELARPRR